MWQWLFFWRPPVELGARFSRQVEDFLVEFDGRIERVESARCVLVTTPTKRAFLFERPDDGTLGLVGYDLRAPRRVLFGTQSDLSGWHFVERTYSRSSLRVIKRLLPR